jgi:hypothetical protein
MLLVNESIAAGDSAYGDRLLTASLILHV